jgi:hypothetical protein
MDWWRRSWTELVERMAQFQAEVDQVRATLRRLMDASA